MVITEKKNFSRFSILKKNFESFFWGGVTKGQNFFFRFLAELGHSESILIFFDFLQNRSDREGGGAGGTKNPRLRFYRSRRYSENQRQIDENFEFGSWSLQ